MSFECRRFPTMLIAPLLYMVVWFGISAAFNLQAKLLPDATTTISAAVHLGMNTTFWSHLGTTVARVIPSILASILLGVPIGLLATRFRIVRQLIEPASDLIRGIPVATIFPVAIILFGIGEFARFWLAFYVCFPVVLASTIGGASPRQETIVRRGYLSLHGSAIPKLHHLCSLLWDAAPSLFTGIKLATSLSLVVIIVSEMFFVGGKGIGWFIWDRYQSFQFPQMYAAILIVGCGSMMANSLMDRVSNTFQR